MSDWIAIEDEIPDDNVVVLVYTNDGMVTAHVETNIHGFTWVINDQNEEFNLRNVTHWMPLPTRLTRRAGDGLTPEQILDRYENNVIAMQERRRNRRR